jgi:hypothetical protein
MKKNKTYKKLKGGVFADNPLIYNLKNNLINTKANISSQVGNPLQDYRDYSYMKDNKSKLQEKVSHINNNKDKLQEKVSHINNNKDKLQEKASSRINDIKSKLDTMTPHVGGLKGKIQDTFDNVNDIKNNAQQVLPMVEDKVLTYKKKVKKFINKISFIYFILPIVLQTLFLLVPYIIIFFTFIIVVNALIMGINQLSKVFYNSLGKPLKKLGIKIKKPKKIQPIEIIVWEGFLSMFDEKNKKKKKK